MFVPITGYNDYSINEDGIVIRRNKRGKNVNVAATMDSNSHFKIITLWKNGKRKVYMLHNLVAENFGFPVEVVKRHLYRGYSLDSEKAKESIRKELLSKLEWYVERDKDIYKDEILFIKELSSYLNTI